jgi:prophage DNA circulation protein
MPGRDIGSFRGASFVLSLGELAGGRKVVVHDYPFRNQAFAEDLGLRGRVLRVEGYVVSDPRVTDRDDYVAARDALQDALEQPGPGTLVHPYYGARLVVVPQYNIRETIDELRIAHFQIDFFETAADAFSPSIAAAPGAQVDASADATHAASQTSLTKKYRLTIPLSGAPGLPGAGSTRSLPNFSFNSITSLVQSASRSLHNALAPLARTAAQAASLKRSIDSLVSDASKLVRDPLSLATRLLDLFRDLTSFPRIPSLGVQAFLHAADFTSVDPPPPASTTTRQYELVNYMEVDAFLRRGFVTEAARQLSIASRTSGSYGSYEEAVAARDQVLTALDELAEQTGDDEMYAALLELRADVAAAVPAESASLPRLVSHTPPVTTPALVLAHRLYGDVDLADDLVARNRVRHPGFVIGGRELQVLSHG